MTNPILLIVRRGAARRFEALKHRTAALPVEVIWDRRERSRRVSDGTSTPERRKAERRRGETFTWSAADFEVVMPEGSDRHA